MDISVFEKSLASGPNFVFFLGGGGGGSDRAESCTNLRRISLAVQAYAAKGMKAIFVPV